jgi:hypothetical protein
MNKSLIAKAEIARKRLDGAGQLRGPSAQAARDLRVAARSMALASSIKPHLTLDELRAKATAASKQMGRG